MCSFRQRLILMMAMAGFGLAACGQFGSANRTPAPVAEPPSAATVHGPPGSYKVGKPYQVAGRWYYPKVDYTYQETGIASWYGPGFHGRRTANGEVYDQNALTAAHPTLPMPSMVRVTNLQNGRSIKVRINDRGPFKNGRIIDLSRRAADLLGFRRYGTAKVLVEIVEHESRTLATAALTEEAEALAPEPAPLDPVAVAPLPAVAPAANQTAMAVPRGEGASDARELVVPQPDGIVTTVPVRPSRIFVQAGAFREFGNAKKLHAELAKVGPAKIAPAKVGSRRLYRVRFGPMGSVEDADRLLATLIDSGHSDARVVVD